MIKPLFYTLALVLYSNTALAADGAIGTTSTATANITLVIPPRLQVVPPPNKQNNAVEIHTNFAKGGYILRYRRGKQPEKILVKDYKHQLESKHGDVLILMPEE